MTDSDSASMLVGFGRRPPTPLFELAVQTIAGGWLAHLQADNKAAAALRVRAVLAGLPSPLADALTAGLVAHFVKAHAKSGSGDALVLVDMLAESVTTVDLSSLGWLGQRQASEVATFSAYLAAAMPRLPRLASLTLSTHGQYFSLPSCSDETLLAVGRCCPELRTLDVSHNTAVSASGLDALYRGCPLLEELLIYDCVLPAAVLAGVLLGLPNLRVLGHQEVGAALLLLDGLHRHREDDDGGDDTILPEVWPPRLRLTQVANLGETAVHRRKSSDEASRLRCRPRLVRALRDLCPDLTELRVRVLDGDVQGLGHLQGLSTLELRFHAAAKPSSLGVHTLAFLRLHGAALSALTVYSHSLRALHFHLVGRHCPQLRQLWMRCNVLVYDGDREDDDEAPGPDQPPRGPAFPHLENLSLRVGWDERSECRLPAPFLVALVRSAPLRKLYIAANSTDMTDAWLASVLAAGGARLRTLFVLLPNSNSAAAPRINLGPASVRLAVKACPHLEELGNLLVWSFHQDEVRHLRRQLRKANSALRLVAKETVWR